MAKLNKTNTRSWLWIVISCAFFFFVGIGFDKMITFTSKTTVSIQKKSLLTFSIPQVPLPSDWSQKENLPGNSFETAIPLSIGIQTQGTLNENNVIDYYSFTLKDPAKVLFDITNVPKSLYWILYDSNFKEIAASYRTGTASGTSQVSLQNQGLYYIKVWADYSQWTNYPYTIRLSVLPFIE